MKNRTKVIDRLLSEAATLKLRLPFERGAPRAEMIARRRAAMAAQEAQVRRDARRRIG